MEIMELNHEDILRILPDRDKYAHKGNFGKLLLLCGSRGYTGAAALAAMGALRSGAGLVYLAVPESIYTIEAVKLTEPVVLPMPDQDGKLSADAMDVVQRMLSSMDAVLIGPGLGQSEGALAVLAGVLGEFCGPVVVDADGINLLAGHMDIVRERRYPTILTPHDGEFARICPDTYGETTEISVKFARENGCVLLRKGHGTLITDGESVFRNPTGNPGMAVGGSGDVLSGIIVSLLGQGIDPVQAAACGAWLHGAAGDRCAQSLGQYGMLPTDMLEVLPRLMK